jgi:hypothetical protein
MKVIALRHFKASKQNFQVGQELTQAEIDKLMAELFAFEEAGLVSIEDKEDKKKKEDKSGAPFQTPIVDKRPIDPNAPSEPPKVAKKKE